MATMMPRNVMQYDAAELIGTEQLVLVRGGLRTVVDLPALSHDAIGVDALGYVLIRVAGYVLCLAHVAKTGNLPPFPAV